MTESEITGRNHFTNWINSGRLNVVYIELANDWNASGNPKSHEPQTARAAKDKDQTGVPLN
ncbi:unnamed protein product [Penicillium viridicatum]